MAATHSPTTSTQPSDAKESTSSGTTTTSPGEKT
ncbi:unnamed protein product [Linum tenue]|uniref:Uncharacterized protein n=1 Tax=Linum tenue TaxID=586396 RepID=A0AAV0L2K7_9ROSI|nr:unnamed protein product [Linum tenue]